MCSRKNDTDLLLDKIDTFDLLNKDYSYSIKESEFIIVIIFNPLDCTNCDIIFTNLKHYESQIGINILPVLGSFDPLVSDKINIEYMRLRIQFNLE